MTKKLFIACAGAGKTTRIVKESIELTDEGKKVLVITYTRSNQNELYKKFDELGGQRRDLFIVKGWYSFILEDVVRPYQRCIFTTRIDGINLNSSNPHKRGRMNIPGRKEKLKAKYNEKHFLTSQNRAHTEFLSKLGCRIVKEDNIAISERISSIYSRVYLDETQDFAGWDFDLIKLIAKSKELEIHAVGDFRQTIYHTSSKPKAPSDSQQKLEAYGRMGFISSALNECWRSIQPICEFADTVHKGEGYSKTVSKVEDPDIGIHTGIHFVSKKDVSKYVKQHTPLILRHSANSGKELDIYENLMTFGDSKGQTVDHVLIHPTDRFIKFLKGQDDAFADKQTSQNKLYVAITRARYSVAFIVNDKHFDDVLWQPAN